MVEAGGGKIIFISSNIAQRAQPESAHYVASKGGLNSLVINLAAVLGPHGIQVNAISPGEIYVEAAAEWFDDPANQELFQAIPLGGIGQPGDVAGAAVFLASSESDYVTGVNIAVDGGQLVT
jgi:NAD(P)-dependent dehydrogenase (short-subunit alcohol dehydrogenase family)